MRFQDLTVESNIFVGDRSEPNVGNTYRNFFEASFQGRPLTSACTHAFPWGSADTCLSHSIQLQGLLERTRLIKTAKHRFVILDDVSGEIEPGCMTLLLGPPGAGKSTLLKTLANKMRYEGCKVSAEGLT